ncbi:MULTISPECIES: oligopeptidase A [Idiomarina]|jgi:oligopeptidase A|nr:MULTISPECIES: oligopeptidase A [Idiomarina]MBH93194.1 oligopeptidase A [Idiomarina sp.]|tara:strand:+ start:165774 stop:167816 length:2043 start_codon:yes stop_codon:yes gene_type:complete
MSRNPLLEQSQLPDFEQIKPEHIQPALKECIEHARQTIDDVLARGDFSWNGLIEPLTDADEKLEHVWAPVSHLNSVVSTPELREAHDSCLPLLSDYATYVGQHKGLFDAYETLRNSDEFAELTEAQQKLINDTLRDFRLSGVDLPADKKKRYAEISSRLSDLSSTFSNNLLDATHAWTCLITDESRLAGLPDSIKEAAKETAADQEKEGWLFTLDIPSYLPVMLYAEDRELRKDMYQAFVTRASETGPNGGKFDNSAVMDETLALRHEMAKLLGFNDYAEMSLATKMAESSEQVLGFVKDLADKSVSQAKEEYAEVEAFAKEQGVEKMEAWDVPYFSEQLKQQRYSISDELLRPYFPEQQVLNGLFEVVKRLFGMTVSEQKDIKTWHENVRFFRIHDADGHLRGSFYLDLYARQGKRGGAWMADFVGRRVHADGELQNPVAFLTCNFSKPVGGKPALFTHDEVLTLFHEFGHGLHHMLTQVDTAGLSGINGVEWDAVELPSQFLENWCWEPEALALISGHYETGEPLPQELLDKMLAARNYQSAMQMMRQLEFSLFDMRIHHEFDESKGARISEILSEVREQTSVRIPPEYNRFQHSFGHIFAGGYAAGYYSYKWAEVLSSDAFARFEEEGIFSAATGRDFLQVILERGGSRKAGDLFQEFRGREPSVEPLLRHSGIKAA